ncbi:MAG TPA: hypothetical protein VKR52_01580 [Terracidiphilus sp.]|nr:hypothetical protein [Terracidiphilus sp.]
MKPRAQGGDWRLTALIEEATAALARMDAERLTELVLSGEDAAVAKGEDREAGKAMRVFARVLEATRENVEFLGRLQESPGERLEYKPRWPARWSDHGDD